MTRPGRREPADERPFPERRAVVALVAVGVLLRTVQTFPLDLWGAGADSLGTSIVGLHVLDGRWPVFYNAARLGALESYAHAAAFAVFGVSLATTALAPLLAAAGFLAAAWALLRSLLGPVAALAGLAVLATGPPSLVFWTYQPNGWGLTLLLVTLALLAADRIVVRGATPRRAFLLGLTTGLGIWSCLISLAGAIAAATWVLLGRPDAARRPRILGACALGLALGAGPWLSHNATHGWPSLTRTSYVRSTGAAQALDNVRYLATHSLPELVATLDPEDGMNPPNALQRALRWPALLAHLGGLLTIGVLLLGALRGTVLRTESGPRPGLLLLVGAATVLLNVLSEAGSARDLTVRYVLPAVLLAAGGVGLLVRFVLTSHRSLAFTLLGLVLAFNLSSLYVPGTPFRERMRAEGTADAGLAAFLRSRDVEVAWGDYWVVYPQNFYGRERLRGIPVQKEADLFGYTAHLPAAPVRWVLCSRERAQVEAWATRAGIPGEIREAAPARFVFLPAAEPAARRPATVLHDELLRAFPSGA